MRLLAVVALLTLALAGCSGGSPDDPSPPAGSSSSSSATAAPAPVPTSDTLHFLAAPAMAPALPPGSSESATPVTVGNFGQAQPRAGADWAYSVTAPTNVTAGEAHLWIDVKETMYESPSPPGQTQCTWRLTAEVGADIQPIQACVNEPIGPINPGTKELVFTIVLGSPVDLEANETIQVRLERAAFSLSANNAVDALSGSAEHDSRITLRGLKEPAPA